MAPQEQRERILNRPEATLVAKWLKDHGNDLEQGWLEVWKLLPSTVAEKYNIDVQKILVAARRQLEPQNGGDKYDND